jgi:hypothetical protein
MPDQIQLSDYVELGMYEIDINNQMWPTGDSNNKFYTPSSAESVKAVAFRQAVACLTDRDSIVRDVLDGYGYRMDVPIPPSQSAYMDMINYTYSTTTTDGGPLIYDYNKTRAIGILNAAGFTLLPGGRRRDPTLPGNQPLAPITFYIRQDDPNRRAAGEMLTTELRSVGIDVNAIITERTVCYQQVMVIYQYNLYTGGWSLSTTPDQYHDLYSSFTYYGPTIGWSQNYPGFCNSEFDAWAAKVKYPADEAEAQTAAKTAGYLFLKYCAIVPMYCSKTVKAYRTGWTGVVNNAGIGVDNYYTFLNGNNPTDDTWSYGFRNDIERLNQVNSQWLWDQKVLGLMYESLMGTNPFNSAQTEYWISQASSIGSWDATAKGGDVDATYINFAIRPNVYWHNNMAPGRNLDVYDVNFSFYFTKACGPGVAWNYPSVRAFDHCVVDPTTNTTGIYFLYKSAWAFLQAGGLPILNRDTWGILWNTANPTWRTDVWNYDPVTMDLNNNGLEDIYEDGTGAWYYVGYEPGEWVTLKASTYYYLEQGFVESRLATMFHDGAGDVDRSSVVGASDLGLMARSFGMILGYDPNGTDWNKYNAQCDLNSDGTVDGNDVVLTTTNYGKTMSGNP